jgi:hypothetical protein
MGAGLMGASAAEYDNWRATLDIPQTGLEYRYDVKKVDDPTGKHEECQYFVLDPKHDKHARAALCAYAASVAKENPVLAGELERWAMNP